MEEIKKKKKFLQHSLFHRHFQFLCRCPLTLLDRQSHVRRGKNLQSTGNWIKHNPQLTIAWEVAKSNVVLFHESLRTNQIRKWSVHVKILKGRRGTRKQRCNVTCVCAVNTVTLLEASERTLGSKMASTLSGTSSSSESEFPALMSRCSKADSSTRSP